MNPAVPITMAMGLLLQSASSAATDGRPSSVSVSVDTGTVLNTMRGGIGASWHAIEEAILYSDSPHPVFGNKSHGGSGWGAYPPAEDAAAWQQIDRHARWLGLDWNRVELEQRIYEPQREQFTWDNREMRILYRILDWCETNKADVFLQQMWGNVAWNTFPEWRDDPAGRVHSGPASMDDFAEGLARLVEHLVRTKGYTCIRWLSINNEPNGAWSWWQRPPNRLMPLRPGLAAVRKALDARGLHTPLSGPDMTGGVPPSSRSGSISSTCWALTISTRTTRTSTGSATARCSGSTGRQPTGRRGLTAAASRSSCPNSARWPTAGVPTIPGRAATNRC
jgi:hypothetical protein